MTLVDSPQSADKPLIPRLVSGRVSVVVCTCQRPALLERCLDAVSALRHPGFDVVVVDNAPGSDAVRVAAARRGAAYVAQPVRGVSRARNSGARHSGADIVAYLDDDMVPHPDWLSALVAPFDDPRVAAVSGPVLPMRWVDHDAAVLRDELGRNPWGPAGFELHRGSPDWFERANFGGFGDGNMAFRRNLFDEWNGFEVRIGRGAGINGGEEHYAFFEIIEKGRTIAYTPHALVFHAEKEAAEGLWLSNIAESSAYATFLALCRPRYAPRVLRFYLEGLAGKRRAWRCGASTPVLAHVSRLKALGAFVRGSWTCLHALAASRSLKRAEGAPLRGPVEPHQASGA